MTIAEIKLYILYLVNSAPGVSYQQLMNKCMESLYVDFFGFSDCYKELIDGNLMDKVENDTGTGEVIGSNETLYITDGGLAILNNLIPTINDQTMGFLKKAGKELEDEAKRNRMVTAFIDCGEASSEYIITLKSEQLSFCLTFRTDSLDKAKIVCKKWREKSSEILDTLFNQLELSGEQ